MIDNLWDLLPFEIEQNILSYRPSHNLTKVLKDSITYVDSIIECDNNLIETNYADFPLISRPTSLEILAYGNISFYNLVDDFTIFLDSFCLVVIVDCDFTN